VHAPAIRRDGDGDPLPAPIEEESHLDLRALPALWRKSRGRIARERTDARWASDRGAPRRKAATQSVKGDADRHPRRTISLVAPSTP
jgi:hypothetical protein